MNPLTKARLLENTEISRELLAIDSLNETHAFLALTTWTTVCHRTISEKWNGHALLTCE